MSIVLLAYAALSMALGIIRPGLILALCFYGYIYESYFGPQIIGTVFGALPIGYALFYALTKKSFRLHAYDAAFLVFVLLYLIATMRSPDIHAAAMYMTKFMLFAAGPYLCVRCFVTSERDFDTLVRDFAGSVVVLLILFGIVATPNEWGYAYSVGAAHAVAWSLCINAALCFLLSYLWFHKDWRVFRFSAIDLSLTLGALALVCYFAYLNGKRGGTTSPVLAVVAVGVFLHMLKSTPIRRFTMVALALMLVASLPLLMQGLVWILTAIPDTAIRADYKSPFYVVAQFFGAKTPQAVFDQSALDRFQIYGNAFSMIRENPVFGSGVYSLQLLGLGYSHSILLEPWVEGGIFMLLSFLIFSAIMFWCAFGYVAHGRCRQAMALVLTATVGCYVQMLTALTLYEGKMLWIGFGIIMAGVLAHIEHGRDLAAPATRGDPASGPDPAAAGKPAMEPA